MNNDRELLELAAKAMGLALSWHDWGDFGLQPMAAKMGEVCAGPTTWNPRTDDGDCARMEAALGIDVEWHNVGVRCSKLTGAFSDDIVAREPYDYHNGDKQAARRLASLRVASAIGKAMP